MKKNLLTAFLLIFFAGSFAQPGVLDQTFGVRGKTFLNGTGYSAYAFDLKIQPDQKIVVLYAIDDLSNPTSGWLYGYLLARFQPNGKLDSSFGVNGYIVAGRAVGNVEEPHTIALQPDGKILVSNAELVSGGGAPPQTFKLTRYTPNGVPDNSFGSSGTVITNFTTSPDGHGQPVAVFVLPNGKIMQGGWHYNDSLNKSYQAVIRLNANGTPDHTYGTNGQFLREAPVNSNSWPMYGVETAVLLLPNNQILISSQNGITRFKANGGVDSTYGTNGTATTYPGYDYSSAVLQPDGKAVFFGSRQYFSIRHKMHRFNADGTPDYSFNTLVDSITQSTPDDTYAKLMLQPNGQFMLGHYLRNASKPMLSRLNSNGTRDYSYGKRGDVKMGEYNTPGYEFFGAAEIQPDGKVVVGLDGGGLARFEKNALVFYNTVIAKAFYDNNLNGIQDANESWVRHAAIISTKPGLDTVVTWADNNGHYLTDVDTGTYQHSVKNFSLPYYNTVPAVKTTTHTSYFNTDSIAFAAQPRPGVRDVSVSLVPLRRVKAGFHTFYFLEVRNAGTDTAATVVVKLVKSSKLNYNAALPSPTTAIADTVTWNFASLLPRQNSSIVIDFIVKAPPAANAGNTVFSIVTITSNKPDSTDGNNKSALSQVVQNSYDPNDKAENHGGKIALSKAASGEYLTYTIRFQNTGNDTALNVYIRDTMDSKLDWNSLQIVAGSHNYKMTMNDGKCLFTFPFIMLVDSLHNEPKSHGYIVYKIKAKPAVQIGDVIKNTASIYFDYNLPVKTNTDITTVVAETFPLHLLSFFAKKDSKTNLLQWTTANEINVYRFEVERSFDGREFAKIGNVKATAADNYSYTDNNPATTLNLKPQTTFYRLKMLDKDGQFTYSPIRVISNYSPFSISIYPNPAKDKLQLQINSDKQAALQLQVLSLDGKVLLSNSFSAAEGASLRSIHISAFQKGSYLLKVVSSDKEENVVRFEKL